MNNTMAQYQDCPIIINTTILTICPQYVPINTDNVLIHVSPMLY